MPVTGELIRLMNYVDDIAAILRRVNAERRERKQEDRNRHAGGEGLPHERRLSPV